MDKDEYSSRASRLIAEGPYEEIANPLSSFVRTTSEMLNKHKKFLGNGKKYHMLAPNPVIPRLYVLYKDHKPDNDPSPKVRPIASNINALNEKVAKWLLKQFQKVRAPFNLSVKNAVDFVRRLKDIEIEEDETLVSFDVTSLYPSVPIEDIKKLVEQWLTENKVDDPTKLVLHGLSQIVHKKFVFPIRRSFL